MVWFSWLCEGMLEMAQQLSPPSSPSLFNFIILVQ